MFSGDSYHTEIKIYNEKNPAESITKFYKQSRTCIKSQHLVKHGHTD